MKADELPETMVMEDVAKYLRIARSSAYELAKHPDFPALKFGRSVRVNREAFLRWVQSSTNLAIAR